MEKEGWGESAAKPGGETVRHGGVQKGGGQSGREGGVGGWGELPRQVSECKRQNTQTSVCKTDSQTDRIH